MSSQKTEAPTDKRLRDARERGQVAKSRDLATAAAMLVAAVLLAAATPIFSAQLREITVRLLAVPDQSPFDALELAIGVAWPATVMACLAVALVVAMAVGLQFRPEFHLSATQARWERIDPAAGIKRLVSIRSLYEVLKSLVVVLLVGLVGYVVLSTSAPGIMRLSGTSTSDAWPWVWKEASRLLWAIVPLLLAFGVVDLLFQRWRLRQDLRMSREEIRREVREAEGDPDSKAARSRVHQEILAHAVLESVRDADVLVINPTHLAIALRYDKDDEDGAPEVVARGQEHLAKRMIEVAEQAGVPVMRDVPLARALYLLELGEQIPEALFEAVAEVLQAAWAMREEQASDEPPTKVEPSRGLSGDEERRS